MIGPYPPHGLVAIAVVCLATLAANAADARPTSPAVAQRAVDRWLEAPALRGVDAAVVVQCTSDGVVLAKHKDDTRFATASAAKLLTTAAALETVDLSTRWRTTVHGRLQGTRVEGDLRLVGQGDPQLLDDDLDALAEQLVAAGVGAVDGDLVVDAGWFDADLEPPGFDIKETDAAYEPLVSGAGASYGSVDVVVRPARRAGDPVRVTIDPASDAVALVNDATTVAGKGAALVITAEDAGAGRTRVTVRGSLGEDAKRVSERKRVVDPGLLAGHLLARALDKRGVTLAGGVRVVYDAGGTDLPALAAVESAPLADLLRDMNTWSNNAMAETLFKQLGRGADGAPATWARARSAAVAALEMVGVSPDDLRLVNGSGLYIATHAAPRALARLLVHYARGDDAKARAFRDSLPVAGQDGTMKWRLRAKGARGKVRAKTGTLDEVVALAGYAPSASGCDLAFVVLVNGATAERTAALRKEVDRLVLALTKL